jgi:hypothetical protein
MDREKGDRERERQRERQRQRETESETETERDRERDRERDHLIASSGLVVNVRQDKFQNSEGMVVKGSCVFEELLEIFSMSSIAIVDDDMPTQLQIIQGEEIESRSSQLIGEDLDCADSILMRSRDEPWRCAL